MFKKLSIVITFLIPTLLAATETSIEELLVRLKTPKQGTEIEEFEISEKAANAWAVGAVEKQPKLGVRELTVDFRSPDLIATDLVVDMDQLEIGGYSEMLLGAALTGLQELKVVGRLEVSQGNGRYTVQQAALNGVDIPAWLANTILSYLSTNQPPNVDVTQPFALPYGISDIRLTEDRIIISR